MYQETFGIEDSPPLPPQEKEQAPARRRSWRDVANPAIDTPEQGRGWRSRRSAQERRKQGDYWSRDREPEL